MAEIIFSQDRRYSEVNTLTEILIIRNVAVKWLVGLKESLNLVENYNCLRGLHYISLYLSIIVRRSVFPAV